MNNVNTFLSLYKELENCISTIYNVRFNNEGVVKWYEDNKVKDDATYNKLKICRVMRNYISHNQEEFLEVSDTQIDFIRNLIKAINNETALENSITINKCKKIATIKDIPNKLSLFDYSIVIDSKGCYMGIITSCDYIKAKNNKEKIENYIRKRNFVSIINNDFPYSKISNDRVYLIVDNKGKVTNVIGA